MVVMMTELPTVCVACNFLKKKKRIDTRVPKCLSKSENSK